MTHTVKLASLHGSHLSEPILTISTRLFSFHTRVSLNVCSEENYSWIVESSAVHAQVLCLYHFVKFCFHICLYICSHEWGFCFKPKKDSNYLRAICSLASSFLFLFMHDPKNLKNFQWMFKILLSVCAVKNKTRIF